MNGETSITVNGAVIDGQFMGHDWTGAHYELLFRAVDGRLFKSERGGAYDDFPQVWREIAPLSTPAGLTPEQLAALLQQEAERHTARLALWAARANA